MRAIVTGGLGFLGGELGRRLVELGSEVVVYDAAQGDDVCDETRLRRLLRTGDVVFHLAAVRAGLGEQDFDLAVRVNLDGSRSVLEACRAVGGIRLVFASTLAVFDPAGRPHPQTTYGATKAAVELLLNDYRRKGYVDARGGRPATIIVRPDAQAKASSAFASAIFREPLAGRDYQVPVALETRLAVIGIGTAVGCFVRLAEIPSDELGLDAIVNLPNISPTVGELADAARRAGATGRIEAQPDPRIEAIVSTWPREAAADRALALGLPRDESVDAIAADYLRKLGA